MNLDNKNFHVLLYSNFSGACKKIIKEIKDHHIDIDLFCIDHPDHRERLKKSPIKTVPTLISMENNQLSIISDPDELLDLIKIHVPPVEYKPEIQPEFKPDLPIMDVQLPKQPDPSLSAPPHIPVTGVAIIDKSNVMAKAMEMAKMREKQSETRTKL